MKALLITMVTAMSLTGAALAQGSQPTPQSAETLGAPITLAGTAEFTVGPAERAFRVLVSVPNSPPPPEGYGIIYALDAGWTFGTLREAASLLDISPDPAKRHPTVVVALGWPTETLLDFDRRYDDLVGRHMPETLDLIVDTLIPQIEQALPVDPAHRMLLGHSFGGAFALQARRTHPHAFSHFAAGSPSIWTDPDSLLTPSAESLGPVLLTIGALESPDAAAAADEDPARVARLRERAMVPNVEAYAQMSGAQLITIADQDHGGSIPALIAQAVQFLWQDVD